ncbi:pilus assembly protein Flp/PilA [Glaciihabitans tibetensis]|uniref:Pilus assembly protein Flp/PilA n=1 Tax=Glaciihabitans tibetensis TaxID=1266600 RepID=A0A2T0VBK3_9MICO|nr:Flp family type IVb pilin [Glaciihabitans tibetensis]PRY67503.1 pilus assembly protein Flp/PilA [Glaciihabitans tibetensis]
MLSLVVSLQSYLVAAKDRLSREETGATAVEYGLIIGLIAVAIVAVLIFLGPQLAGLFQGVSDSIPEVATTSTPAG